MHVSILNLHVSRWCYLGGIQFGRGGGGGGWDIRPVAKISEGGGEGGGGGHLRREAPGCGFRRLILAAFGRKIPGGGLRGAVSLPQAK